MQRADLSELHYITNISNVRSILSHGILSHQRAGRYKPVSIAMEEIQQRRSARAVPGGRPIHNYACLYLHARNPMMYKIKAIHEDLAVLRLGVDVLDIPGAILADGNAASDYTRFYPSPDGLLNLDGELVLARYWISNDYYEMLNKKRVRCAELLVPDRIAPEYVRGAYVSCAAGERKLVAEGLDRPIICNPDLFFGTGV